MIAKKSSAIWYKRRIFNRVSGNRFLVVIALFFSLLSQAQDKIGKMEVQPDVESHTILLCLQIRSSGQKKGTLHYVCGNRKGQQRIALSQGMNIVRVRLDMGKDVELWSEFHPHLHTVRAWMDGFGEKSVAFGMREFGTRGEQLTINNLATYLRSTADSCVVVHPADLPSDVPGWLGLMKKLQDTGFNSFLFCTYAPSEEAYQAADSLGLYLQVENGDDTIRERFGHHPSFLPSSIELGIPTFAVGNGDNMRSPVVPLAVMTKSQWNTDETFTAQLRVSNYTEEDLSANITCALEGDSFRKEATFSEITAPQGRCSIPVVFTCPLNTIFQSGEFTLTVTFGEYINRYRVQIQSPQAKTP